MCGRDRESRGRIACLRANAPLGVAFRDTFKALDNRIKIFTSLPLASLDRIKLQEHLDAIGKTPAAGTK